MKKANIVIGRFQPFTKGHEKMLLAMHRENMLPTLILSIPNKKFDNKHPFSDELISDELRLCLDKKIFAGQLFVNSADIVKAAEICHNEGFEPILWGCGTDRYAVYKKQSDKYRELAGLTDEFDVFEIKRTDEDISATKVREALKNDDKGTYDDMMPKGAGKLYSKFREELLSINESYCSLESFVEYKKFSI